MSKTTQRGLDLPEAPKGFTKMPNGLWTPGQTVQVADNLSQSYDTAPEAAHHAGSRFYSNWNQDAQHIGDVTGQGVAGGAAILAHLSPSTEAETNRLMAMQLVHGLSDEQLGHLTTSAKHAALASSAVGSRSDALRKGNGSAAADFDEVVQRHSALSYLSRDKAGLEGTPLHLQTSRSIVNASAIAHGEHGGDPLSTLGALKINDFGRLIFDPKGYERAPIDTHYHDAALNRVDIHYNTKRGLSSAGRYANFQNAHAMAREGSGVSHGDFMGTVWYGHQMRKAIENPDSLSTRRGAETRLANFQSNAKLKHIMPETYGLLPSLGKIPTGR